MDEWRSGEWKAICDVCGFEFFASELFDGQATTQKGLKVCKKDLDKQNPQEFVRYKEENISVPWTRPGDNEGRLPIKELSFTISADVDDSLLFFVKDTTGITITLPAANHANYNGISINLVIGSSPLSTQNSTFSTTSAFVGSTTLLAGTQARLRNIPSQNIWIREA